VTGGAEALYPPEKGEQDRSPQDEASFFDKHRTGAHLVEQFIELPCHASLQKSRFADGAELQYSRYELCHESPHGLSYSGLLEYA